MDTAGQTPTGPHTAGLMGSAREVEEQELTRKVPPENTTSRVYSTPTDSNLGVGPGSSESLSGQLLHTSSCTPGHAQLRSPPGGSGRQRHT
eukprot:1571030-Rhodomonas_salina.1